MTAPANKKRTHNDAARDASRRIPAGGAERKRRGRQSKYGRRLEALKLRKAVRDAYEARPADDEPSADAEQAAGEEEE